MAATGTRVLGSPVRKPKISPAMSRNRTPRAVREIGGARFRGLGMIQRNAWSLVEAGRAPYRAGDCHGIAVRSHQQLLHAHRRSEE
jgi:hypothetical protein